MLRAVCGPPGRWPQTISLQHIEIRQEAYKVIGPNAPHYRPQSTNVAIVVTNRKSTYDHDKTMLCELNYFVSDPLLTPDEIEAYEWCASHNFYIYDMDDSAS